MAFQTSTGIEESALSDWLKNAAEDLGTFEDGRVDYTKATLAPIVMCTVVYNGKILLAKRGFGLADAEGYWSTINGFIDEDKPVKEFAIQEVAEELSISVSAKQITVGTSYLLKNPEEKRSYIVFPCKVTLVEEPQIILNHEHTDFTWINRSELESYHILKDLVLAVDTALALSSQK